MGEFANKIRKRAADVLRRTYEQEPTPGMDSVLEFIGCLLEDGVGGVSSPPGTMITIEEWLAWNQLALERQDELVQTLTSFLEEERVELPTEQAAMRQWAACLLLSTLDRIE